MQHQKSGNVNAGAHTSCQKCRTAAGVEEDTRTDRWCGAPSCTTGLAGSLLGMELAPISPLELMNSCSGDGEDLLPPDPPTVVINSEASPPTRKQKRIARVVMCVAFVLLATCVILVGVTLSMSEHIDDLVRKSPFHGSYMRQQQLAAQAQAAAGSQQFRSNKGPLRRPPANVTTVSNTVQ